MDNIACLVPSADGVYVPKSFVECYDYRYWGVSEEDAKILLEGPEHELYWEAWHDVLGSASYEKDGVTYTLYQDGDLFAVAMDELTDEEYKNFFGEERF